MKKIAAYCRVSTYSEMQLSSFENQRDFFEDFAKMHNYELVKIYADKGISGTQMKKRPEFLNLLEDSKKNLFDTVVTKDVSRFARNTLDFLNGIRTLKQNGIDVMFVSNNKTLIGESEFILTIYAALAQQESENLSKRVIFGKKQSAKSGRTPSVIFGYNKKGTYDLEINESEKETVKLIFNLYTKNKLSMTKIATYLNSKKIPTKNNKKWDGKSISRILKNPIYTGILINNKTTTDDFLTSKRKDTNDVFLHKRDEFKIVSKYQFECAKKIIEKNTKRKQGIKNQFWYLVCFYWKSDTCFPKKMYKSSSTVSSGKFIKSLDSKSLFLVSSSAS